MAFDPFSKRKLTVADRALIAAVFSAFAVTMWLFARTYEPGNESPLTSLRHLRNVIIVQDQAVGSNVVVSYAALSTPSFVVLQSEAGKPGKVLAASRLLPEGEARNFRIAVEGGVPGGFYYATLRRDDGDGTFEADGDPLARDARGAAAITRFLITDGAAR